MSNPKKGSVWGLGKFIVALKPYLAQPVNHRTTPLSPTEMKLVQAVGQLSSPEPPRGQGVGAQVHASRDGQRRCSPLGVDPAPVRGGGGQHVLQLVHLQGQGTGG